MTVMETAYVRIKFTPLLQKVNAVANESPSKYYIEILPEVAAYENLDNIKWKEKNELVEYTIPMTYKIVIKKPQDSDKNYENKVYHSCVDLVKAHSLTDCFGSGDFGRIISEGSLLRKQIPCPTYKESDDVKNKNVVTQSSQLRFSNNMSVQTLHYEHNLNEKLKHLTNSKATSRSTVIINEDISKHDKVTGTNIYPFDNNEKIPNNYSELDDYNTYQCKLQLSPVCSINIGDQSDYEQIEYQDISLKYFVLDDIYNRKDNYELSFQHKRDIPGTSNETDTSIHNNTKTGINDTFKSTFVNPVNYNNDFKLKNNSHSNVFDFESFIRNTNRNRLYQNFKSLNNNDCDDINTRMSDKYMESAKRNQNGEKSFFNDHFRIEVPRKLRIGPIVTNNMYNTNLDVHSREKPKQRLERMTRLLEKEIYPLKLLLNEIRNKCLTLGLGLVSNEFVSSKENLLYRSISYISETDGTESCNVKSSNRVVYSIVFNE